MKLLQRTIYFTVFYLTLYSVSLPVLAQLHPNKTTWQVSQKFQPSVDNQPHPETIGAGTRFKPPVDDQKNPETIGAGTRGSSCFPPQQVITSLLPANQSGLTVNDHPTFFWHIPKTSVKTAEFIIITDGNKRDEEETVVYETTLSLPQKSGIISLTLPKKVQKLKANTSYRWYFTMICDDQEYSNNPYAEGVVKRIPTQSKLSTSLSNANLLQTANLYAQAGIWHDALTSLVKLRCNQPNNPTVKLHWQQFLDSVKLNNIASEPLLNYCQIKK